MAISRQNERRPTLNEWRAGKPSAPEQRAAQPASGRSIDAVDLHVGSRVRVARKAKNLTQEALAAQLGVTFQQLQKYEKGANRISASRLHHAARVLGVPVAFFFPEAEPAAGQPEANHAVAEAMDFLASMDGIELSRAFARIEDAAVRRHVIDLVRSIARRSQEER